ncbi:unnamed protein product [Pedinophyceae sp. YPF-701]|nr:unnamed protein product [Pedinophyceae sp. YPF-701]
MFIDLNVPLSGPDEDAFGVAERLEMLGRLGYRGAALAETVTAAPGAHRTPPNTAARIDTLRASCPPDLTVHSRLDVVVEDMSSAQAIVAGPAAASFDVLAARPTTDRLLQQCCASLDVDVISLDLAQRSVPKLRPKDAAEAVRRGVRFEICYAPALRSQVARRNVFVNSRLLVRAAGSRGVVLSSGAASAMDVRAPHDVVNMATVMGVDARWGKPALSGTCAELLLRRSRRRRTDASGAVEMDVDARFDA